mgnify:CR=1 FL=1
MSAKKISFIGAGSYGFTFKLIADIVGMEGIKDSEFVFMDVNKERLDNLKILLDEYFKKSGYNKKAVYTMDLREGLTGADFIINLVKIGFLEASEMDMDVAKKYGLFQTIGDTGGLGGIFRGLRTIAFNKHMCDLIEQVSNPGAIVLNYTNPQAISVMAASKTSSVPFIGLCHSIQGTTRSIAKFIGVPYEELVYDAAGINHLSWITRLEHKGADMYPKFRALVKEKGIYCEEYNTDNIMAMLGPVRLDMLNRVGYMVTESSNHFAEYVPFYLRTEELRQAYRIEVDRYKKNISNKKKQYKDYVEKAKTGQLPDVGRSVEHGPQIINSMVTGEVSKIYANVMNTGLITNLPETACVEVACMVDRNGIRPCHYGKLPTQLAALCSMQINAFQLTVEAFINKDIKAIVWALMADPATHSTITMDEMEKVVDELVRNQQEYLGTVFKY